MATPGGGRGGSNRGPTYQYAAPVWQQPPPLSLPPYYGNLEPPAPDTGFFPLQTLDWTRDNAYLPSYITSSRASTATYYGSGGIVRTAANDQPRFDYKFDGTSWVPAGLLIEEQRTNLIIQSTNFSATPNWPTVGSFTAYTGVDDPAGGTTAATFAAVPGCAVYQAIALTGPRVATVSVWLRKSASGGSSFARITTNNGLAWNTGVSLLCTLTTSWQRFSITGTVNSGGTDCYCEVLAGVDVTGTNDSSVNGNIDIWGAQLEVAPSLSSFMLTTTAAVTRSADIISSTDATLLAADGWEIEVGELQASTQATLLGINTAVGLGVTSGNALQTTDGGTQTTGNTATWTGVNRGGLANDPASRVSIDLNGGTVVTAANTAVTPTVIYLGNTNNGASDFLNGHIRSWAVYSALTDAQMQGISTLGNPYFAIFFVLGPPIASLATTAVLVASALLISQDTLALADTAAGTPIGMLTMPNTATLADTASETPFGGLAFTSTLALADTAAEAPSAQQTMPNILTLADTATETPSNKATFPNTLTLADTAVETPTNTQTMPNTLTLADTAAETPTGGLAFTTSVSLADAAAETASALQTLATTLTLSDTASQTTTVFQALATIAALADTAAQTLSNKLSSTSIAALADIAVETTSALQTFANILTLADTATETPTNSQVMPNLLALADVASQVAVLIDVGVLIAALANTAAETPISRQVMPNTLAVSDTASMAPVGGMALTASASMALTASESALVSLGALGTAVIAATNNLTTSTLDSMFNAVAVAVVSSLISSTGPATYGSAATLSDTAALVANAVNVLLGSGTLSTTTSQTLQSVRKTTDILAVSTTATEIAIALNSMKATLTQAATAALTNAMGISTTQNATLSNTSAFVTSNRLTVNGTVSLSDVAGMVASSPFAKFNNVLTFTAHFDAQATSTMSTSQALVLAAHLSLIASAVVGAVNPIFETVFLRGIRQFEIDLSGIRQFEIDTMEGVVQLSIEFKPVTIN